MFVFVATYEHKHGRDTSVYATAARAESWRRNIAANSWHEVMDGAPPEDPAEAADAYFARGNEIGDEFFNVEECEVMGFLGIDPSAASEAEIVEDDEPSAESLAEIPEKGVEWFAAARLVNPSAASEAVGVEAPGDSTPEQLAAEISSAASEVISDDAYDDIAEKVGAKFSWHSGQYRVQRTAVDTGWHGSAAKAWACFLAMTAADDPSAASEEDERAEIELAESVDPLVYLYEDPDGEPTHRCRLSEAFPEAEDRAAALASMKAGGSYWTGGGASPFCMVALAYDPGIEGLILAAGEVADLDAAIRPIMDRCGIKDGDTAAFYFSGLQWPDLSARDRVRLVRVWLDTELARADDDLPPAQAGGPVPTGLGIPSAAS